MLFRKYQIVIFRDREAGHSHLRLRGWLGLVCILLFLGLSGAVIYLWNFYPRSVILTHQLGEAEKTIEMQNAQIVAMASKLQSLQEDVKRVQQFDAKLRVMMNVDREAPDTSAASEDGTAGTPGYVPLHRRDLLAKHMHSLAEQLEEDVRMEEIRQQDMMLLMRENREFLSMMPSIWPAEGHLSSVFGVRASPFTGQSTMHAGLDISNRPGTPVIAPAKGTVTFSAWDGAYGHCIVINHGNGLSTRYAHLLRSVVKEGQVVSRGDLIGHIGSSGRTTGPHLHYEVRVGGAPVNPMRYILN